MHIIKDNSSTLTTFQVIAERKGKSYFCIYATTAQPGVPLFERRIRWTEISGVHDRLVMAMTDEETSDELDALAFNLQIGTPAFIEAQASGFYDYFTRIASEAEQS